MTKIMHITLRDFERNTARRHLAKRPTRRRRDAPFPRRQLLQCTKESLTVANLPENGLNTASGVYNPGFYPAIRTIMEAEQLNTIANRLADLAQRTAELRRYL